MLILYIGLPKTASTFLQREIFPRISKVIYIHRTQGSARAGKRAQRRPAHAWLIKMIIRLVRRALISPRTKLGAFVLRSARHFSRWKNVFISNENLSIRKMGVWDKSGSSFEDLSKGLEYAAKYFGEIPVKIVIGFRSPDTWLASRYAQSADGFPNAGQQDFESRVRELLSNPENTPAASWLFQTAVRLRMERALGSENCHFYQIEDLEKDPAVEIEGMMNFLGNQPADTKELLQSLDLKSRRNVRRIAENAWVLKGSSGSITLTKEISEEIRRVFQ
jgi:hypothetical protein